MSQPFIWQKVSRKLHRNEGNGPRRGNDSLVALLNPSMNIINTHRYKPVVLLHQHSQLLLVLRPREQREVREIFWKRAIVMRVYVNLKQIDSSTYQILGCENFTR